ncbi:MAG: hypothetical protein QM770_21015 [Tepidisphaeraceae bacterium]
MTISEVVPILADLVEKSPLPRSDVQRQAIEHLKTISDFVVRRNLDEWEAGFPWESTRDGSVVASLLEDVYELGRYNLYTQFNRERTLREYATVGAKLLQAGLSPPQVESITDW